MFGSRVAAIELLLREGLGRPPQAEEAASPRLPRTAEAVEKLGWNDMQMIFATQFASEIAAVTEDGGRAAARAGRSARRGSAAAAARGASRYRLVVRSSRGSRHGAGCSRDTGDA